MDAAATPAPFRVAVTGSSGMIGSALVARLRADGHDVLRLVRHAPRAADEARWDPAGGAADPSALAGLDAVVNLAGENVGQRWTEARRRRIRQSRIDGTKALVAALVAQPRPAAVLVNASAIGIYGDRGDERLDESAPAGDGFLAEVVRAWEAATEPAAAAGVRVVLPRLGVVLSARGGALAKLLPPFRFGVGGPLGSGRQWMSWISLEDVVTILDLALHDERISGPVNVVAGAVTNAELARTLGHVLHRPALLPVPAFALRLALGKEMANETALVSQRVEHRKLLQLGYSFIHPELEGALRAAIDDGVANA